MASKWGGSPMGGRPFSGQWGEAVGVGGQWAKARPQWGAYRAVSWPVRGAAPLCLRHPHPVGRWCGSPLAM